MDPGGDITSTDEYYEYLEFKSRNENAEMMPQFFEYMEEQENEYQNRAQTAERIASSTDRPEPPGWARWILENPREFRALITGASFRYIGGHWCWLLYAAWNLEDLIRVLTAWPLYLRYRFIDGELALQAADASKVFLSAIWGYIYAFLLGKLLSTLNRGTFVLLWCWKWIGSLLIAIMIGKVFGFTFSEQTPLRIVRKLGTIPALMRLGGQAKLGACIRWLKQTTPAEVAAAVIRRRMLQWKGKPEYEERPVFKYPQGFESKTHIRVLRLKRKIPFMDLEAEFIYRRLEDAPLYDAISHVWGSDAHKDHPFILHGKRFPVTKKVYDILLSMSSLFGDRDIWIDSLCIDQDDTYYEKRHQISKMVGIYKAAVSVHICLEGPDNSWLAGQYLQEILIFHAIAPGIFDAVMLENVYNRRSDKWLSARIDGLLDLINNQWFRRIWIVQEFVAGYHIVVHYGGSCIPWEDIIRLHHIVTTTNLSMLLRYSTNKPGNLNRFLGLKQAYWLDKVRTRVQRDGKIPLDIVLAAFRDSDATQVRDKILALLDLSDASDELRHLKHDKSTSKLIIAVANHMVRNGTLIQVLPFAGLSRHDPASSLPSWVPDWTRCRPMEHIDNVVHLEYEASGNRPARISATANDREIMVTGIWVDSIRAITKSEMPLPTDVDSSDSDELLQKLQDKHFFLCEVKHLAEKHCRDPYPYPPKGPWNYLPQRTRKNQPLLEAVSRTLIGDSGEEIRPAPDPYATLLKDEVAFTAAMQDAILDPNFDQNSFNDSLPFHQTPFSKYFDNDKVIAEHILRVQKGHWLCGGENGENRFCVTDKGYIGMAAKDALPGDAVCIVYGHSVPFVLRPSKIDGETTRTYRLVGECYVHGLMDGEGLDHGLEEEQVIMY